MELIKKKNLQAESRNDKPILTDLIFSPGEIEKPVIIFCHGYKGFKDWGAWEIMGEKFAREGYLFVKFNFSHNGITPEYPFEFRDIEAFGDNNYIKELDDLQFVIDWLFSPKFNYGVIPDHTKINLIGHSRGGGIVLIKSAEEARINKVITFSAVSDFGSRFPEGRELQAWKEKGVAYIVNSRTGQQLPHHFQFYTNFKENEERLTISRATKSLKIPNLIVHGSKDLTVPISDSGELFRWSPHPDLLLVEGADHVYGCSHPWDKPDLPSEFNYVLDKTLLFLAADNYKTKDKES